MSEKDKTTEASKVELTDEQLDDAEGGGIDAYLKLDGIDGESQKIKEVIIDHIGSNAAERIGSKTLKGRISSKSVKW